jgi:hypothetical protein
VHAEEAPGAISFRAGRSTLQRAKAKGQRGWKWQPGGGFSGEGISPFRAENFSSWLEARHLVEERLRIGWFGAEKISSVGASSTMRPRYITATRSEMCSTTPRSWLTKR